MQLGTTIRHNTLIVTMREPRIDAAVAIRFKDAMRAATQDGPARVVLDMSQVGFVDSSGLGAIVAAMKQLGADRRLDLAGLSPDVVKVFRLTRMDRVFGIYGSVGEALDLPATG